MNPNQMLTALLIALFLSISVLVFLFLKSRKLNKEIKNIQALRHNDIVETNQIFIEKSENELKLFFQFETVLEETLKLIRKADRQNTELIEGLKDIKLYMQYQLKK